MIKVDIVKNDINVVNDENSDAIICSKASIGNGIGIGVPKVSIGCIASPSGLINVLSFEFN
jgi:hypothetical protein